jgi:hypothetical protein
MKEDILKYITNNVSEEEGSNVPQFLSPTALSANVYNDLGTELANENVDTYFVLGQLFDENSQDILFYGYYKDTSNNYYGYIYIVDENLAKVSLITTFTSGNKLFPIVVMNQDENGYMYAISKMLDDTGVSRVLLFNNIFGKLGDNYIAKLRASYIIPNGNIYDFGLYEPSKIQKVPGEATYFMLARPGQENYTVVIEFRNNVGMENEWYTYNLDELYSLARCGTLIEKEGDNVKYYMYFVSQTGTPSKYNSYVLSNNTITKTNTISLGVQASFQATQVLAVSTKDIYISYFTSSNRTNYIYKVVGSNLSKIYEFTALGQNYMSNLSLSYIKGIIFIKQIYENAGNQRSIRVGIIQDDNVYLSTNTTFTNKGSYFNYVLVPIVVSYNLVKIYATRSLDSRRTTLDYNPLNYNGASYSNYSETVPTKGRLYSGGELVFARNLYNSTINGSTTTSTVQIPNTLLNNTTIEQENLMGATNKRLLYHLNNLTKNVYETLYINFINTLGVIDEDENETYPSTASYINQNINVGTQQNCNDTFVGKVQINYSSKSIVQSINWTYNTDHYETSFVVDALTESPSTIDFISNDETTTYITKEMDLATGHYYLVSQKLRIE